MPRVVTLYVGTQYAKYPWGHRTRCITAPRSGRTTKVAAEAVKEKVRESWDEQNVTEPVIEVPVLSVQNG